MRLHLGSTQEQEARSSSGDGMGTLGVVRGRRSAPLFAFALAIVLSAAVAVLAAQAVSSRSSKGPATTEVQDRSVRVVRPHGLLETHRAHSEPRRYDHWVRNADGSYTYYRYAGDPSRRTLRLELKKSEDGRDRLFGR
jgi:hypothetical protein